MSQVFRLKPIQSLQNLLLDLAEEVLIIKAEPCERLQQAWCLGRSETFCPVAHIGCQHSQESRGARWIVAGSRNCPHHVRDLTRQQLLQMRKNLRQAENWHCQDRGIAPANEETQSFTAEICLWSMSPVWWFLLSLWNFQSRNGEVLHTCLNRIWHRIWEQMNQNESKLLSWKC